MQYQPFEGFFCKTVGFEYMGFTEVLAGCGYLVLWYLSMFVILWFGGFCSILLYTIYVFAVFLSEGICMRELRIDELDITDVTLLSVEETKGVPDCVKKTHGACFGWWLSSKGFADGYASFVYGSDGHVDKAGLVVEAEHGVRPVVKIANLKSLGFDKDSKFRIGNRKALAALESL